MIGTARVHRSRRPPSPPRSPTPARQPVIAAARGSSRYTVQCDAADPDPDGAVSGGRAAGPPDAIPAGEYAPADRGRARCLPNVRRLGSRRRFQDLADVATKTSPTSLPRPRRRRYQEPAGVATRTSPASLPGPRRRHYQDLADVATKTSPTWPRLAPTALHQWDSIPWLTLLVGQRLLSEIPCVLPSSDLRVQLAARGNGANTTSSGELSPPA
jgi:hypothetical protein